MVEPEPMDTKQVPTMYRSMKRSPDGKPTVGSKSKELGVRVPPDPHTDVDLDSSQFVILNRRGMSVVDNWRIQQVHLIPKRLKNLVQGAIGSDNMSCWRLGLAPFAEGTVTESLDLVLKTNNSRAGNIVPRISQHVQDFQDALESTRNHWIVDEK